MSYTRIVAGCLACGVEVDPAKGRNVGSPRYMAQGWLHQDCDIQHGDFGEGVTDLIRKHRPDLVEDWLPWSLKPTEDGIRRWHEVKNPLSLTWAWKAGELVRSGAPNPMPPAKPFAWLTEPPAVQLYWEEGQRLDPFRTLPLEQQRRIRAEDLAAAIRAAREEAPRPSKTPEEISRIGKALAGFKKGSKSNPHEIVVEDRGDYVAWKLPPELAEKRGRK